VETHVVSQDAQRERLLMSDLLYLPRLLKSGQAKWRDYKMDLIGLIASIIFVISFIYAVHLLGVWLFHDGSVTPALSE